MKSKTESIAKRLKEDTEYQKFFRSAMEKFGIKSPSELEGKKKKEFFDYVDQNYKAKSESVNEDYKAMEKNKASYLGVMRAYIEEKYPQDSELKRIYNEMLKSIKLNSQVQGWMRIDPL